MPPIRDHSFRRRNHPHIENPGACYFLTWKTHERHELEPAERAIVLNAIRHWDRKRWKLLTAIVMPDHVHVLARPLPVHASKDSEYHSLTEILHSVKGYSAHRINELRGVIGLVWQDERHDRIVRDEQELREVWGYIVNNPVKAGLVSDPRVYPWLYQVNEIA